MKIPLGFTDRFAAHIQKSGLTLVFRAPLPPPSDVSASLSLRWIEVGLIAIGWNIALLTIENWQGITKSWLVTEWIPQHTLTFSLYTVGVATLFGILLALWKRRQQFSYGLCEVLFGGL